MTIGPFTARDTDPSTAYSSSVRSQVLERVARIEEKIDGLAGDHEQRITRVERTLDSGRGMLALWAGAGGLALLGYASAAKAFVMGVLGVGK